MLARVPAPARLLGGAQRLASWGPPRDEAAPMRKSWQMGAVGIRLEFKSQSAFFPNGSSDLSNHLMILQFG
jgi:hypothetical protein